MCAPDIDTSKSDANAARITDLSEEQWHWVQGEMQRLEPERAAASALSRRVTEQQLRMSERQDAIAQESAADYRRIYKPLEEAAARDAANYNTEAHRAELAGKAIGDVQVAEQTQRGIMERSMASMGVNASDGAYGAGMAELGNVSLLAQADAANKARAQAELTGRAIRNDAIATGRGVVSSQGTQADIATTQGNSAAQNALTPINIGTQAIQTQGAAAGQAINGLQAAGNIYSQSAQTRAQDRGVLGELGQLAGAGVRMYTGMGK